MCKIKFLKRTTDGVLLFCYHSEMYQLLFKNINFNLTLNELQCFSKFIQNIDENYWVKEYEQSVYSKHIPIPSVQANLIILLDVKDLFELRELLNYKSKTIKYVTSREIGYQYIIN